MNAEMFSYPFMQSALLMGLVLGVLFALMGVFVVTRGMAFFSDFIAHSAILGGALAAMAGIESSVFLIPFSLVMAYLVSFIWNRTPLSRDTVLGVFYGGTVALGLIVITLGGVQRQGLMQFLLGDILLINPLDLWLAGLMLVGFGAFVLSRFRHLLKSSVLPEISRAEGINVAFYDQVLIGIMAVTIALSIKTIGVLLANAMVVIPAAAAKNLAGSFSRFITIAIVIGVVSFAAGIAGSFALNIPSGPSVIAAAFIIFIITLPFKKG